MMEERLFSAIRAQRAPHAVLICGPRGSGRKRLALRAAALCCTGAPDTAALKNCPDFHLYGPEPISIDNVRALKEALAKKSFSGGWRCAVLLDAHLMKPEAQHAFLKTLEEPPKQTFLLLTGDEHKFLPTIRSRCATLRLGGQPYEQAADELIGRGWNESEARQFAAQASGLTPLAAVMRESTYAAMRRDSLALFDAAMQDGMPPFSGMKAFLDGAKGPGTPNQQKLALARQSMPVWFSQARDMLLLRSGAQLPLENPDRKNLNSQYAQRFTIRRINDMIELFTGIQRRLDQQASPALTMDLLLMELSRQAREAMEETCKR